MKKRQIISKEGRVTLVIEKSGTPNGYEYISLKQKDFWFNSREENLEKYAVICEIGVYYRDFIHLSVPNGSMYLLAHNLSPLHLESDGKGKYPEDVHWSTYNQQPYGDGSNYNCMFIKLDLIDWVLGEYVKSFKKELDEGNVVSIWSEEYFEKLKEHVKKYTK